MATKKQDGGVLGMFLFVIGGIAALTAVVIASPKK